MGVCTKLTRIAQDGWRWLMEIKLGEVGCQNIKKMFAAENNSIAGH